MSTDAPALTVVLAGLADAAALETTLLHLRAQTVRDDIEVIVVTSSVERLGALPLTMDEMHSCRVIEVPSATIGCEANAAGARAAAAPIIAFAEDHSYVDPHLGAALLEAHEGDWAAVGPEVGNANPATMTSWADFVISYGPWMEPADGGRGRSSSATTAATSATCCSPPATSSAASSSPRPCSTTSSPLPATGLYLEPRARVSHLNFSRWTVSLRVQFHSGRVYASTLREGWSTPRKAIYALASPLIPLVRFGRSLRLIRRPSHRDIVPTAVIPALALGILSDGAGQGAGAHRRRRQLGGEAVRLRVPPPRQRHGPATGRPSRRSSTSSLRTSDA